MSGVVNLAPELRGKNFEIGALVKLEVMLEGQHGVADEKWKVVTPPGLNFVSTGSLSVASTPVEVLPSEGNTTKLSLTAVVTQPGPVAVGTFFVQRENGEAIEVSGGSLEAQVDAPPPPRGGQEQEDKPVWILPPVAFGGWNTLLLAVIFALILAALGAFGYWIWRRIQRSRLVKRDHREEALAALQDLQKYSRSKAGIQQEEWKKFSFELAGTLRRYADRNFGVQSFDRTDRELLSELRGNTRAARHVPTLAKILETIDAVRYGRQELNVSVVGELLLDSRRFIKDSFVAPLEEGKK